MKYTKAGVQHNSLAEVFAHQKAQSIQHQHDVANAARRTAERALGRMADELRRQDAEYAAEVEAGAFLSRELTMMEMLYSRD